LNVSVWTSGRGLNVAGFELLMPSVLPLLSTVNVDEVMPGSPSPAHVPAVRGAGTEIDRTAG